MVSALTLRFDTMALAMSRPFATKQGSYYLNVKVPLALRTLAKGQRVSLPLDGEHHSVVVGEKVVFSLRTKEAKVARERFPPAIDALNAFFKSLGAPPQTLNRTDARALAGEIYRQAVQDIDRHDAIADEVEALRDELAESSAHYQREGEDEKSAELSAAIDLYDERALLAWGLKQVGEHSPLPRYRG